MQQHDAVVGQRLVGHREEVVPAVLAEVLEGTDRHDAVDGLVELLPTLQQHALAPRALVLGEDALDVRLLVLAEGESDDVDVVLLDGPQHRRAPPAAADVEQGHARFEAQLAQRQVDLGELSFLQRHVVALEVGAAVGLGGVEEETEEFVRQVVVGLDVLEVRLEATLLAGSRHGEQCLSWLISDSEPSPMTHRAGRCGPQGTLR